MSTPSTATATLPPHHYHPHQHPHHHQARYFSHHQSYQPSSASYQFQASPLVNPFYAANSPAVAGGGSGSSSSNNSNTSGNRTVNHTSTLTGNTTPVAYGSVTRRPSSNTGSSSKQAGAASPRSEFLGRQRLPHQDSPHRRHHQHDGRQQQPLHLPALPRPPALLPPQAAVTTTPVPSPPPLPRQHHHEQQQQHHHQHAPSSSGDRDLGYEPRHHQSQLPRQAAPEEELATPQSNHHHHHHHHHHHLSPRKTDWADFYRRGVPKEIIVIDDDSPGPRASANAAAMGNLRRPEYKQMPSSTSSAVLHAAKRRKVAAAAPIYDPTYQPPASHSSTLTPYDEPHSHSISRHTGSSERAASGNVTTAPTSLGSTSSYSHHYSHRLDPAVVGQKRKRTRKAAADEAEELKRRELEDAVDAYSYVPPPVPPIKAGDVRVPLVSDLSYSATETDDKDGHFVVIPESDLTDRYTIVRLLGQGTFGKVVEAVDRRRNVRCAVKIIRSIQKYRDASRIELRVLTTLASNDRSNRNRCIHLRDCFDYRNHICIVTDLYGQSVFDFLKSNQFVPFPSTHIQKFAKQLFTSVAFLHDLHLIHTDLKPENILLVNHAYQTFTYNRTIPSSSDGVKRSAKFRRVLLDPEIRLIDFGSATFEDEYHSSVVSTRHYRAPEIILNIGWSFPCDIWSIGCILVEFFTGDALFQTHDNLEHLAMMGSVCGSRIDKDVVRAVFKPGSTKNPAQAYFRGQKLDYPNKETPRASRKYVREMRRLEATIPQSSTFNVQFLDLLRRIFIYNPAKRITAKEALSHPWFSEALQDDGTEATRIRAQRQGRQPKDDRYS